MKKYFIASLVKNGILGGGIVADEEAITYHTGKLTIPDEYRHLVMKYKDIDAVTQECLFILPTKRRKLPICCIFRKQTFRQYPPCYGC